METEKLLHDEIHDELEKLSSMEIGSNEYESTVNGVTKLLDRAIEIDKMNLDAKERELNRINEEAYRKKQLDIDRKDRWIKSGIALATTLGTFALYKWGLINTFQFEKEGTITTSIGRGLINSIIPKRK